MSWASGGRWIGSGSRESVIVRWIMGREAAVMVEARLIGIWVRGIDVGIEGNDRRVRERGIRVGIVVGIIWAGLRRSGRGEGRCRVLQMAGVVELLRMLNGRRIEGVGGEEVGWRRRR